MWQLSDFKPYTYVENGVRDDGSNAQPHNDHQPVGGGLGILLQHVVKLSFVQCFKIRIKILPLKKRLKSRYFFPRLSFYISKFTNHRQ